MKDSFRELMKKSEVEPSKGFVERLMLKIEAEKVSSLSTKPEKPIVRTILILGGALLELAGFLYFAGELQIANLAINFESIKTPLFVLFAFLLFCALQQVLVHRSSEA